ncbi:protein YgfX [Methyloglobulus sp.]|uniref:protein YgfX n=1 Tax=Methyloglobulus sp. TaxID=2518622 RepID=UPI00398A04D8
MYTKKHSSRFIAELNPSKKLLRLLIFIHVLALGASIANTLPFGLKLGVAFLIGLNFKMNFHRLKIERRKIRYTEKLAWEISDGGDFEAVDILKSTVITTTFIFLQMQNKPTILIASDALDEVDYRQLIVKLKITLH